MDDRIGRIVGTSLGGDQLGRSIRVDQAKARFGEAAMQPLFDGFLTCDETAMAVVEQFAAMPSGTRLMHTMLNQALDHGIDSVENPPGSLVALFGEVDAVPDWVDWDQIDRGAVAYFRPGPLVSIAFTCAAVAAGNYGYGVTRPQALTGRYHELAYTRSAETFRWLLAVTTPGALRRDKEGLRLTVRVRILHAFVRHMLMKSPRWDWDDWGMPICDVDQAVTLAGPFTTAMIEAYTKVGIRYSRQEIEDIYALFRYVAYLLGTPEHLIATTPEEAIDLRARWQAVDFGPDENCVELVRALIELATQESGDDDLNEIFSPTMRMLLPPLKMRAFMYGMTRYWAGDAVCDALKIPDTGWKHSGHFVRLAFGAKEALRPIVRHDDHAAGEAARALFKKVLAPKSGEDVIASPTDVERGIREREVAH